MVEITTGISAKELNRQLIIKHNILIKNLVANIHQDVRQYIRLAIRNSQDNDKLIDSLKSVLSTFIVQ